MEIRLTATLSPSRAPLPALPSLPTPPVAAYRCPKLLEYRLPLVILGLSATPSALANDRLSPKLDGAKGGEGRKGVTGEDGGLFPDGTTLTPTRDDVGDVCEGRDGSDGPPLGREPNGEC